jgi:hypothetical protein
MKNIHVLPTDKPSRLRYNLSNVLVLTKEAYSDYRKQVNKNIYITSDEEIKEGDWYLDTFNTQRIKANEFSDHKHYGNACQKIILTTDQDLIKDGVQAIDDEFLEWFVKNPSCEEVEVGYGWIRLTETDNEGYWVSIPDKQFEMQQEEPKQETLEEAFYKTYFGNKISFNSDIGKAFELGAKWQAERMYSEEEVLEILFELSCNNDTDKEEVEEWFEQFKKK